MKAGDVFYKRVMGKDSKRHVVGIVRDEIIKESFMVWRGWNKYKKRWFIEVESLYIFNLSFEIGLYSLTRRKKDN